MLAVAQATAVLCVWISHVLARFSATPEKPPGSEPGEPAETSQVAPPAELLRGVLLDQEGVALEAHGPWADIVSGVRFDRCLAPASRAPWRATLWPRLQAQGRLDEVLLAFDDDALLSFWRRTPDGCRAWCVPAESQQRVLGELERASHSLACLPGAVVHLDVADGAPAGVRWASEGLADLLGLTPQQAMAGSHAWLEALEPAGADALVRRLDAAPSPRARPWTLVGRASAWTPAACRISSWKPAWPSTPSTRCWRATIRRSGWWIRASSSPVRRGSSGGPQMWGCLLRQ